MFDYCDNSSLSVAWHDHGLSRCFSDTLTSSITAGSILVAGTAQIVLYRRYSTPVEHRYIPRSCLYQLQVLVTLCLVVQAVVRFILQLTTIQPATLYGYNLLTMLCGVSMWCVSLVLVMLERSCQLPSVPPRGHGLVLLIFWTFAFASENLAFVSWLSDDWWWINRDYSKKQELGLWITRFVCTGLLFMIAFKAPGVFQRGHSSHQLDEDQENLLDNGNASGPGRQDNRRSTFSNIYKKLKLMWPYIWPRKNIVLQILVIVCIILLIIGRVVNLYLPIYYKKIVDSLTITEATVGDVRVLEVGHLKFRWDLVLIYAGLRFLSGGGTGGMGLLNNMRNLLWVWVQQYTTRRIGVHLFSHLHSLSLKWHLSRKTGEVLRVMDRGTNSINQLLSYILFQIVPTIADIIVALVYFLLQYDFYFALIIFITMALYLVVTIAITEWRTKYRREMNLLDNQKNSRGVDSLLNFETVKYYGAENFEVSRYEHAIVDYQKAELKSNASLCLLNTIQGVVINAGFLAGTMLCAWYVSQGKDDMTVGDFVLFATYILQLYAPLNWFGTYYRMIQQSFIDMENMFDLLSEKQEVRDVPQAGKLHVNRGMIEFNKVSFSYDLRKPILKDISFVVPPGQTFALVGPSGSGKSTIIRLLFRFYDVQSGAIKFDSQDISKVTQESLRSTIGVVPQDTVLFNDDIRYNIRYGRVTATDLEVENAARAADIHSRILTFPDLYDTKVGERGLKLSGGEKQRVAIARTILKAPNVVLLDEATSALDTQTERNIQSSLAKVCENRTTIIVAHRLSTIVHADQILVLKNGEIVERGRHEDLLLADGVYADMWAQQSQAENEDNGDEASASVPPPTQKDG